MGSLEDDIVAQLRWERAERATEALERAQEKARREAEKAAENERLQALLQEFLELAVRYKGKDTLYTNG